MVSVYTVRFSNFAIGSGKSPAAEVLAAGGLAGTISQAGQAMEEARLLTERMFYQLKREPTLLRWQADALQDTSLATPEVGQTLADTHRLTDQLEQLPKNIAAEREAIVAAVDERMKRADATVANVRAAISDLKELVASVGSTSNSLGAMFTSADSLWMHYDSWDRWSTTTAGARPFDVREYAAGLKELGGAAGQVNEVLKSSNQLLGNPEWDRRVQQVNESADERVRKFIAQSQEVENNFFLRSYVALGVLFVTLLICLMTAFVLMRRLIRRVERNTSELKAVEKQEAVDHGTGPGAGAGGAEREGVSP
jgi:preprotein translocase subunit YajC